ncbi:hypothetical protein D3Z60_04895 [Lachnospiraceae bacterium]|jgi:uncharacterized OB-fold protein|nr:hypothetical protein [Lachnospiraceae bacterium]
MTGRYDIVRSLPHGAGILHSGNTGWGNAVRQCAFGRDKEQRNMEKKIYREKSMKRISSPEQLDDYIKVTGTGMWMIMGAVMLLLACVCVWGIFGHLDTVIKAPVVVKDGTLMCYIKETDREQVAVGMQVEIRGKGYSILSVSDVPAQAYGALTPYAMHIGGFADGEWVYMAAADTELADGVYEGEVVVESIAPAFFIFN